MENSHQESRLTGQARFLRPCYYFNKGTCRNGERCKFAHVPYPANAPRRFIHPRPETHIDRRPNRNLSKLPPAVSKSEPANETDIAINNLRDVAKDFVNSNSWLLTCVGIQGCPGNIDGFLNISPEEARFFYNEAQRNNALDDYFVQLNDLNQNAKWCFDQVTEMNDDARSKLMSWMDEQKKKSADKQSETSSNITQGQNECDSNEYEQVSFLKGIPSSPPKEDQCDR